MVWRGSQFIKSYLQSDDSDFLHFFATDMQGELRRYKDLFLFAIRGSRGLMTNLLVAVGGIVHKSCESVFIKQRKSIPDL